MAQDQIFRHLMSQMFPSYYVKYGKLLLNVECPDSFVEKGALTEDLFESIAKTFCVLECVVLESWSTYLKKERALMAFSPKFYILNVIKACLIEKNEICDKYERFVKVCSLVTAAGKIMYLSTKKPFYELTPSILTVLFENVLKEEFKMRGGWKLFGKYLEKKGFEDCFGSLEFSGNIPSFDNSPDEIKNKIKRYIFHPPSTPDMKVKIIGTPSELTDLVNKVISSVDRSLLTELRQPDLFERQLIPNRAEMSASNSPSHLNIAYSNDSETTSEPSRVPKPTNIINAKAQSTGHGSEDEKTRVNLSRDNIAEAFNFRLENFERTIKSIISIFDSFCVK
ncbi:uncharacterized protein NPIL_594471 [Nephila pilipes]|uniref:Uncharacterized protein n=1 Tax=Nephila pilipes TaxID=299642 RepID=A0A8X6QEC5_NEPPI|nr:uncharacterized protein NPIL_594471 [Nephila pilipes]